MAFSRLSYLSSDDSTEEEELLLLAAVLEEEGNEGGEGRIWVHEINLQRETFGEFHHLVQRDLEVDEDKFRNYFRLSRNEFYELLTLIKDDIEKMHTNWRTPISPKERLAICLR